LHRALCKCTYLRGGHSWAGRNLRTLCVASGKHLHLPAADVGDQNSPAIGLPSAVRQSVWQDRLCDLTRLPGQRWRFRRARSRVGNAPQNIVNRSSQESDLGRELILIFILSVMPAALFASVYLWGSSFRISRSGAQGVDQLIQFVRQRRIHVSLNPQPSTTLAVCFPSPLFYARPPPPCVGSLFTASSAGSSGHGRPSDPRR
jgi:hypothetical protein